MLELVGAEPESLPSMTATRRTVTILLAAGAFTGCHRAAVTAGDDIAGVGTESSLRAVPNAVPQAADRRIIRTGRMDVEVRDLGPARDRVDQLATAMSATIANSSDAEKRANILIRGPAASLDAMMDSLARLGKVRSRGTTATDVTEQMVDTEARLGVLRDTRDRLRQLLARADGVQDVVAVERELSRVQADIEAFEARLRVLSTRVAMSDLHLTLTQAPVLGPLGVLTVGIARLIGKLFVLD